jgi:hypothetical protein
MKMSRADREIESLIRDIESGGLDLQPEFQRGEVWRYPKQQLLIDSVLRGWYVPPIHVIEHDRDRLQEVLDGHQRLRSILNFYEGRLTVDGYIQPLDQSLTALHNARFPDLPDGAKRAFLRFTISQYTLTGFAASEPAELFFRLNQNLPLTPAETRNAYIGEIREQVKNLVAVMDESGLNYTALGFTNARMSYDDVVARLCLALERGSIAKRVSAKDLDDRYRSGFPFAYEATARAEASIRLLAKVTNDEWAGVRFNKATLFSWLWFVSELSYRLPSLASPKRLSKTLRMLEIARRSSDPDALRSNRKGGSAERAQAIAAIYHDRATSRVADVASVVLRDVAIWVFACLEDEQVLDAVSSLGAEDSIRRRYNIGLKIADSPADLDARVADLVNLYAAG